MTSESFEGKYYVIEVNNILNIQDADKKVISFSERGAKYLRAFLDKNVEAMPGRRFEAEMKQ